MYGILLDAMETTVFGRDNSGSPSSRSDVQAPCVCIRLILSLGDVHVNEFAYALWRLADKFEDYSDVVDEIEKNRIGLIKLDFAQLPNTYTDAKPISFLKNTGFIFSDGSGALRINPQVEAMFMDRLKNLKIYGVDLNIGRVSSASSQLLKPLPSDLANYNSYIAAIRTKPFVLLAGISGTGKSRLVRQLARGCCPANSPLKDEQKPGNFEIIPVKPNWHDSTELMGFVTRITEDNKPKYVLTPFVKFLAKAWMNPDVPFFLCLDEMNLAPVEQYFAEYLSVIESRTWVDASDPTKGIKTDVVVKFGAEKSNGTVDPFVEETVKRLLPDYETAEDGTPVKMLGDAMCEAGGIRIPSNLVVMGTVNMDETTCSFSRKVLDRAMTFELNDVSNMYTIDEINTEGDVPFGSIDAGAAKCSLLGAKDAVNSDAGKVEVESATHDTVAKRILDYIKTVNEKLEDTPFKIAYRSRDEIMVYCLERIKGGIVKLPTALDEATSMKILSRIEGDDQKLTIQVDDGHGGKKAANLLDELEKTIKGALKVANGGSDPNPECSVCSGKLEFMKGRLEAGFTNFFV